MDSANDTQKQLADSLDRVMLDILENGEIVTNETGEAVRKTPTAAMLRAIHARVKDIGLTPAAIPGSQADRLIRAAGTIRFNGKPIPAVDTESDDAATG